MEPLASTMDSVGTAWAERLTVACHRLVRAQDGAFARRDARGIHLTATDALGRAMPGVCLGVGPQLLAPADGDDRPGADQWRLGPANAGFNGASAEARHGRLAACRAGVGDTPSNKARAGAAQPVAVHRLGGGWHASGASVRACSFANDDHAPPLGLRLGNGVPRGATAARPFVEPPWSAAHRAEGQWAFRAIAAVSFQIRGRLAMSGIRTWLPMMEKQAPDTGA